MSSASAFGRRPLRSQEAETRVTAPAQRSDRSLRPRPDGGSRPCPSGVAASWLFLQTAVAHLPSARHSITFCLTSRHFGSISGGVRLLDFPAQPHCLKCIAPYIGPLAAACGTLLAFARCFSKPPPRVRAQAEGKLMAAPSERPRTLLLDS
jgi:hypothetical protein